VSTSHQSLDQQLDALHAVGVAKVFTDTGSGARNDRPGLAELMSYTRSGDTVVVVAAAREAARSRGRQVGRPPALTAEQVALAQRMRAHGESVTTICTTLKVGRSTLYRHLA